MPEESSSPIEEMRESIVGLVQSVIQSLESVPLVTAGATLIQEAIRSAGQAGLLYREACRSKSRTEFYAALPPVAQCVEGVVHWLGLAQEHGVLESEVAEPLIAQARAASSRLTAARVSSSSASSSRRSR